MDVNFDEDVRSSSLQGSPLVIESSREVSILDIDSKTQHESDSEGDEVRLCVDMLSHCSPMCRRLRWLTET